MPDIQTLFLGAITGAFVLFGAVLFGVAQWSKRGTKGPEHQLEP